MLSVSAPVPFSARPPAVKFSSDIYLVNRQDFFQLRDKLTPPFDEELHSVEPWSENSRVYMKPRGATTGAVDCSAGGFTNGRVVSLFHLFHQYASPLGVGITFERDVEQLKKNANMPTRALITGGRAYASSVTRPSRGIYDALNDVIKEDRVTRLWGRKSQRVDGSTNVIYDAAKDSWYLYVHRNQDQSPSLEDLQRGITSLVSKSLRKGPFFSPREIKEAFAPSKVHPAALSLDDLKDTFEVVQIAPGDHLKTPNDPGYRTHLEKVLSAD